MINCIIQDMEGYLWFATEKGIGRYDGYSFQSYINIPGDTASFVNAAANSIYMDKEGTLWFGSMHGLEKYNRTTNTFTNYLPDRSAIRDQTGNTVYNMIEDTLGNFWVSTGKGIFRFYKNSGKFLQVQYDKSLKDTLSTWYGQLYVDKDGALWVGTNRGLDKFNYETGKLIHYWHDPKNLEIGMNSVSKYYIRAICEDNYGTFWLGTSNGLVEFNKKSNTFTNYLPDPNIHDPFKINQLSTLCYDSRGILWVGTGSGIFTFDTKLKKFVPQFINRSIHNLYLGNNFITTLFIDNSEALWSGTLADGIYKVILRKLPYKKYFPGLRIYNVVKGINGILWIQKAEGWEKFDTKTDQITPTSFAEIQMGDESANRGRDKSGNIYMWESNPVYFKKVENEKSVKYNLLKAPSVFWGITAGMWYGALKGGLYYLDFKTGKVTQAVKTNTFITAICKDSSGLVWAAVYMEKLICYDPKNKSVSEFVSDPKNPSSISSREIFKIYEDKKGRLWFATDDGLNRFIPSTKTFIHYTEKDNLSGNTVYNILEDNHGNLWIDTDKGISKFNPEINKFTNFDILQGFSTSDWYYHLAVKMENGEMFFGRSYGLIRFHPDSIKENTYIPPIVITSFKLFDKQIPFGKEIKLSYNKNFLSFEFASLSYYNSQRNQYAYKMEGVDKDWIYSETRRYASYPNLSPGEYIFRVKGSNSDGIWNETGTSISIIITPPWWGTWWFRVVSLFILFVTAGGTIRYIEMKRVKRKIELLEYERALERERTRISRDMHDEIGSNLSAIAILSELAKKNPDEAENHVREISELTAEVIDSVSEIVWAMNPRNDKLDNLIAYIRRYAVKYLGLANINCRIASPEDIPSYPLSAEFRRNIFLVVKEVLHNIVKHSCASEVLFAVNFTDHDFEMKIEDNGKGFSTKKSHAFGNGLSNIRKRIEDIGGFIAIQSASNKGTQISLSVKIDL